MRGEDIALVELERSVAEGVVGYPAPVWQGYMQDALDRSTGTYQVGFGDPYQGKRQYGRANGITWDYDPCDDGGIGEGPCQPTAVLTSDYGNAITTRGGDSGGPVFVRIDPEGPTGNTYYLLGVHSGRYHGDFDSDIIRAPVGSPTHVNDVIKGLLDADLDGDGWDDATADNCSPARCEDPLDCRNLLQEDDDGDGIGDACDNCRQTKECAGLSTVWCWNHSQVDSDDDGIGDACDLCPQDDSGNSYTGRQWDDDGDEVGNECDYAEGLNLPYLPCTDSAYCAANNAGFCVLSELDGTTGRCSQQIDEDSDRVDDSIDLCVGPFFSDPSNANSNPIAESLRVPDDVKGDICDEVPIFRLAGQFDEVGEDLSTTPSDPTSRQHVEPFYAESMYGANAPGQLEGRVVFRQCTCFTSPDRNDASAEMDDKKCAAFGCDTDFAEEGDGGWQKLTVEDVATSGVMAGDDSFDGVVFEPGQAGGMRHFEWLWNGDLDVDEDGEGVDWRYVTSLPYFNIVSTNGLLATVVADREENWQTRRDEEQQLRVSTRRFITPSVYPSEPEWTFHVDDRTRCIIDPGCNLWIAQPWLDRINPADARIRDPITLVPEASYLDLVAVDGRGGLRRVSASSALVDRVAKVGEQAWLAPTESPSDLAAHDISVLAVGVSRSGPAAPLKVLLEGTELQLAGGAGLLAATQPPAELSLEEGVRALYSATERQVYLVSVDNDYQQFLRVYDLESGTWNSPSWAPSLSPQQELLAAAYDASGRRLYVLQVDPASDVAGMAQVAGEDGSEAPSEAARVVRLVEHDLARHQSNVRWEAAWTASEARYELAVQPDHRLALVRSLGDTHAVCNFDPAVEEPKFAGVAFGDGAVLGFVTPSLEGVQFLATGESGVRKVAVHQGLRNDEVVCF